MYIAAYLLFRAVAFLFFVGELEAVEEYSCQKAMRGETERQVRECNCRNPSIAEEKRGDHVSKNLESWR